MVKCYLFVPFMGWVEWDSVSLLEIQSLGSVVLTRFACLPSPFVAGLGQC